MISPHGGTLVSRIVPARERDALRAYASTLPAIDLNARESSDLLLIAIGGMSPLEGFMGRADYEHVLTHMRLASGIPWSLPVTLSVRSDTVRGRHAPFVASLRSPEGKVVGLMLVLRNSFKARRQFVRIQHAHPKMVFPLLRLMRREPEIVQVFWQQHQRDGFKGQFSTNAPHDFAEQLAGVLIRE